MIAVNLIEPSVLNAWRRRRHLVRWIVVLVATAALGAVPVAVELTRQRQVARLTGERLSVLNRIEQTREQLNAIGVEIRMLESQLARADALREKRAWSRLLAMFSDLMPQEMWLMSVTTDPSTPRTGDLDLRPKVVAVGDKKKKKDEEEKEPNAAPVVVTLDAPRTLIVDGYALAHRDLYEFMSRLKLTGAFSDVALTKAADEPVFNFSAVHFNVRCTW